MIAGSTVNVRAALATIIDHLKVILNKDRIKMLGKTIKRM